MERISGIGGVFFRAEDPSGLAKWYRDHLGLPIEGDEAYGTLSSEGAGEATVWSAFPRDTGYFGSASQPLMINYRVRDLDAMLARLRAAGADVDDRVEEYEYGRFGWARDPEGNRFELWEEHGDRAGTDASSALVEEYIESVWNRGDVEALHQLTTPGFRYHLGGQPGRGHSEMAEFLALTRTAFPDWRVVISTIIADGRHIAVRWSGTVTHLGDFHGIPATGKKIDVSGINIYRIEDGAIAEEWEQMDSIGMLRQLGVGS